MSSTRAPRRRHRRRRHGRPGAGLRAGRCAGRRARASPLSTAPQLGAGAGPAMRAPSRSRPAPSACSSVLGVWPQIAEHAQPVTAIDITDSEPARTPSARCWCPTTTPSRAASPPPTSSSIGACTKPSSPRLPPGRPSLSWAARLPRASRPTSMASTSSSAGRAPLRAALLVAADGGNSRLREAAGIKVVRWSYPQIGIVTTVRHEKPHQRPRRAAFPARRAVRHPAADGQPLVHHLDGGGRAGRARSWRSTMPASSPRSRSASAIAWAPSSWPARARPGRSTCIWRGPWWPIASRSSAMRRTACTRSPARA